MRGNNCYELLYMIHCGDEYAGEELVREFKDYCNSMICAYIKTYPFVSYLHDDLLQEALISVVHAAERYREDKAGFRTFLTTVVTRRLWNRIRGNDSLFVELPLSQSVRDSHSFYDIREINDKTYDPLDRMYYDRACGDIIEYVRENLNETERKVLKTIVDDTSYEEAAKYLNCTVKSYDGKRQRVRKKLRDALHRDD